ncbi:tRNA lysidine(34) synthetase TilS [Formivibrio citricus]|uniref:tRNA lysidine(34) synthetase TilS n=1 Tax=Formivibrio citricus TaxID=83765 RepID=UPI000B82956E|nr:tRNA lysidine(34) synthetase TilS [Formivibrio citricus]
MANSRKKPLDLPERVRQCLARFLDLSPDARLCVGFSGGLDSVVLLHLLAGLREQHGFALHAMHVHHGLSQNADTWAAFAQETAAALGVDCLVEQVSVAKDGRGVEAAARQARYAVFEQQACDALLLAHHRDDQSETVLFNLLRGSGLNGLAAMPHSRFLDSGARLVRPLLDESRQTLLDYARTHSLRWIEDESNADTAYDRNFLRHRILPELAVVFPGLNQTLPRAAAHAAESAGLLAELAELDLTRCVAEGGFDLSCAAHLSVARKRNALRHWLGQENLVLDSRAFDDLLRMMESSGRDAEPVFVWRDRAVRRYRNYLFITSAHQEAGPVVSITWREGQTLAVPSWHGRLNWQKVEQGGIAESCLVSANIELRPRAGGERLRLHPGGPSRLVKHLWQEAGIAPWLRDTTPLLWLDGQLAAVPGLGVAEAFSCDGWRASWCAD